MVKKASAPKSQGAGPNRGMLRRKLLRDLRDNAMQDDYRLKVAEKAEKEKRKAAEKARKMERDKKQRELSAKIKAEKEKERA